jgi:hypothetical protein
MKSNGRPFGDPSKKRKFAKTYFTIDEKQEVDTARKDDPLAVFIRQASLEKARKINKKEKV